MDSNIKHLYDTMISRGYTGLGDFSNFEGKMKDSGKRKLVYDHLMQDDYFSEIGDFSKFESALGYSPVERKDYVSQSSVNPAPIALRQEVDVPMKDQSEYVNPWDNSADYNFESLRKKGKIETATPPPPTEYEKDSSFMNTWVGDAIQKLNAGGADLGAGIFGVLDKGSKGLESSTGGLISRGGAFKDISDRFKADAEFSRARSNRYNGKDFIDLWKEGNYMGAIGDIALQGIESLPMSIGAMAATMAGAPAAGLAGIGSIVASQKYDDLDQNNPNMGEFAKVSNAIITGTAESLSEMLGAGVSKAWMSTLFKTLGKEKAQEAIKRGIMGKMQELYKKFGMFFEPVNEGVEEVSSTLAENITDKITGADPERDLTDGVLRSFVYGMGGGAYFTGTGALAKGAQYVADKIGGKQAQQPITDSNVTDQGVNTPPQSTKSIIDDAFEQGRNMSDKGDLRDLSLQMEASRTALTEKNPNLAIRMEQYIDNGASENQINEMLKGVDNETRELAYDFYINTQKIKGVEDKSIENINNEVDSYMSDNIIPYVSISPNGRQVISTATFKEGHENKKVYIRSINGDNVIISDNGNNRMVPTSSLSDIEENDVEQIRDSYRQQLLVTRQSELDMAMNHNPKTQLPKPGLVIWNGDNAFILQGQDENGDWIAQPAALDKETGQVAPKAGSAPAMPITERDILALQDAMYDAQQANEVSPEDDSVASADAEITSAPPVEDAITQPTNEIETGSDIDQTIQPSNVEAPSMVMREDGTPDFVSSGTDMTLDFLYDKYGDKMPRKIEVTRKSFDESLKKASDALEKAQEAYDDAPIGKEDKAEAALIKARQGYEAIKVEADFWANLDDDIKEASKKPGDVIAKEISVIGDPMSGEELAAMMLANGAIKLTRDSYKKETGAGNNETARMFGLFASPEKGGVNIERAGEILELADRENGTNFFDENDTNAGRDAIIEVLSSAHTRGDLIDYVKRNREAIAERERLAEYNAYAEWCEENYHMSPEEYEAYEESMVRDFSEKQLTDEERGELDSQIVDEIQAIIDEQDEIDAILAQNKPIENENIEGNDESGGDGLREGGGEVLPREQLDQTGGTGEVEGRESAGPDIDRTDGATQEGSSRGLVPFVAPSPKENENPLDYAERIVEAKRLHEEENIIKKAKSDGSYMKAPNGNPTNLNEKQWVQVRTKAFKEWFGDWENDPENASKVIDENGEPRVVYHGTDSDFNAFDESHLGEVTDLNATNEDWAKTSHIGFWFNDNKIGFYTKHKPVYLNVRNPLEFASMESLVDEMSYYDSGEDFKRSNSDGYDSVIVLEDEEMGGRSYVVFNDNQIKSATENNEDFSFHNDETSRNEAVKQASEIDGVRFRSIGEKGAANLNKAETIESSINDWSTKFNTPVKVIHDVDDITDTDENMLARKRDSKGWYDTSTGEIVIVSPNSTSVGDAQRTFLHEVVGHHGLRELFGDDFDTFLDNVYRNANEDIRKNIIDRTKGNPLNLREATEEYIAELAERGFDNKAERSLWEKIKDAFLDMLRKAGISLDFKLSDNDLRYILWRSYKNLEQGNLMDVAEDTVMRNDLGVGDFSVRFREAKTEVENEEPLNKEMVDAWDKVASSDSFKFKEAMVDSLTAIDEFLKLLAKKTKSKILDYENPYYALIALSSKNKADMDSFDSKFLNPLNEAIRALIGDVSEVSKKGLRRTWDWSKGPLRDLVKYVQSKHGIERNRDMSVRDGIETLKAFDVDALSKMGVISESDLKNAKKTAEKVAEEKGSEAYKKTYDKVLGKELKKGVDKGKAERSAEIAADYRQSFVKSEIYNKEMDKYKEKVTGTLIDRWEDSKKDILKKGLAWDEEQKELDREALSFQWKLGDNSYGVILGKDYSGLSSVFKPSEDGANKDKWLSDAYDFVRDYESTHNMVLVDNLWDKVHNVSEYTLRRQYESGLISKSYMDKNLSRFKYFIPLRGFSDNIASDVYDYIDATEIKMGNPVKTAKGRISEADNPFAGLIHVGYGSITAGNRNLAKQRFLNLASNHDTGGLITIDNIWVRNVGTEENPEWVESVPRIPDNASGEEVAKAVKDHEEMMRELREEGKAELIKGGRSDIPYKTLYDQRSQHQVQVFVGGNRYVMTVNGNPRLAQAVNGLTNPDVKDDLAYVVARNLKTFMAGAFTSKNVAFSFANLIRDTPYANNSVFVTENFRYFKDFSGNQRRALFGLRSLGRNLYKYRRGEIDISDKEQAIFKEFMDNGGATGYTFVETQKEYAKDLANKLEKLSDGNIGKLSPKELVSTVFECFEFMGNVAELVNRYAAYKTSREHGRSIDRSINDAKEVSVNFNKKGAGKKTKSDKWYINTAAWISEYGRDWVLFFNAAVQSMYKEYSMLRNHPIKGISSRIAPLIFMGSSVSLLNNLFMPMLFAYLGWDSDDDDRDYFDSLSDYERQNNICIRLTHGRWLKIPLSPELANYFKIGDIIAGQLSGKREVEAMDVVKTGIDMVSPLNINWEYDSWKFALNLLPTVVQPIAQNASNVNFMGNPIYKTSMNKANDYDPEYTKVYRSTSTTMVELSRALNSLTGGDDVKRGLSFNPATWQNIFSGYTGGFGTVALGVSDLVLDILSGEDGDMPVSRYPLLSRFLTGGDKDLKLSRMNSIYNKKVVDFVSEMDHDYKGYLEKSMDPSINILDRAEYIVKLEKFMKSDDFKKSQELSQYVRAISDMERFLREVGSDNDSLENQVYELKLRALEIFEDSDE